MEFKGTKGKWIKTLLEVDEDNYNPYYIIQGDDCKTVCTVELDGSITRPKWK